MRELYKWHNGPTSTKDVGFYTIERISTNFSVVVDDTFWMGSRSRRMIGHVITWDPRNNPLVCTPYFEPVDILKDLIK